MPRFFVNEDQILGDEIRLTGPDVNHIRNVLRMSCGEQLTVSDGRGMDYYCSISELMAGEIRLSVIDRWASFSELPVKITLFQGLPKADKLETVIQKSVELGVYEVIPVITRRTIMKLDEKKKDKKLARWQAIAESAAKQAGRAIIPEVGDVLTFRQALDRCAEMDAVLMPYEKAEGMEAARSLVRSLHGMKRIGIFIGPEGGFDEEEVRQAREAGASVMTLGHRILRTETAGMTVLSVLMFELEQDTTD